jgi:hypothetical protein
MGRIVNNLETNFDLNSSFSSYSYFGEDGKKYGDNNSRGEPYGETFTTGDISGCGLDFSRGEIFFTKNGKFLGNNCANLLHIITQLGTAFKKVTSLTLFPAVGMHCIEAAVITNFGEKPFKFDLTQMIEVRNLNFFLLFM